MILKGSSAGLSYAGNLDSLIQTCTCCGCSEMEEALEFYVLRFILLEMKELESKAESSTGSDVLPQEFDEAPSHSLYRMGFVHGNFWRNAWWTCT